MVLVKTFLTSKSLEYFEIIYMVTVYVIVRILNVIS